MLDATYAVWAAFTFNSAAVRAQYSSIQWMRQGADEAPGRIAWKHSVRVQSQNEPNPQRCDIARLHHEALLRIGARDEGRGLQIHVDPLRPVLEIPAAALVGRVVADDEGHQCRVVQFVAGQVQMLGPVETDWRVRIRHPLRTTRAAGGITDA